MAPVGYQEGSEKMWWWKVAMHIDEAQQALANAMAHNLDDQKPVFALQDRLREGQAILLDIFRSKGLLPVAPNGQNGQNGQHGSTNGEIEEAIPVEPLPVMSEPAVPEHMIVDAELVSEVPVPAGVAEPPVTPAVAPTAAAAKPLVVEVVAAVKPTAAPAPAAVKSATAKPSAPATPATPAAAAPTPASAPAPAAPAAAPAAGAPSTPSAEAPSEG